MTLLVADCEAVGAATVGDGKHLRFRVRQHGRDAGSAIAFGFGGQLDRLQRGVALRRRLQAQAEPLERHGRAAARRPARLRHGRIAYEELRTWLAGLWRAGEAAWTPEARRIFAELSIDASGGKRQLLESPTFRELLAHGAPLSLPQAA